MKRSIPLLIGVCLSLLSLPCQSKKEKELIIDQIINLTASLKGDAVRWEVPEGEWTIMRFGARNNGAVTRPAPLPGVGFECDKADTSPVD